MNIRTIAVGFLVLFTGFAQYASADVAPVIRIACHSNNPSYPFELRGEFQEILNRHGQGYMNFTVTAPNGSFSVRGLGQRWSEDNIDYSDSNAQAVIVNSTNYVSRLTINGQAEPMICQIIAPTPPSPNPYYRNGH